MIFDAKLYEDVSSIKREWGALTATQKKSFIIVIFLKSGKGTDIWGRTNPKIPILILEYTYYNVIKQSIRENVRCFPIVKKTFDYYMYELCVIINTIKKIVMARNCLEMGPYFWPQ